MKIEVSTGRRTTSDPLLDPMSKQLAVELALMSKELAVKLARSVEVIVEQLSKYVKTRKNQLSSAALTPATKRAGFGFIQLPIL